MTIGPFESTTLLLRNLYEMVGAVLGLFIAYQAYRGYRRNDSRPMLFIALGFGIMLGPPVLLFGLILVVPSMSEVAVQLLIQTFEIAGLLSIIYALRMDV
ncbi:hypothetical protein EGH22_15375 [Halomicroarcula sp. F28]|uniref:Uncharacterized protein n=2 Tax=Haloarcula salinisoli TaxID=2487746 RepID=A0A8J7YKX7_9EURY|nr:hypothetical protein [Halomicroarcula salinisoli]MBX0304639.1 hypothetical protein [Halomicroarcula salinisoli]